ncbi:Na+/melibiose symporter-like transporter [Sphingobium sp. B11D3B]|uniref:MFS transporter n=1 Tax=Sphingobium sp. B11D3B TaxID=2940575 RepID=UPI0022270004|nr:MFS transporter [Sphingobium sp. B11D3B]MCW2388543.1 Na+/melibiose symporter-like transporter [Sphingobium sp. B11D3B]
MTALTAIPSSSLSPLQSKGDERSGALRLIRFSAVAVPIAAATMPIGVYLPAIFARDFGLSLGMIGFIFLIGRLWDAISDPLIGSLSDRTRSRFGRRKPWMAAGAVLFTLSSIFLFFPVATVTPLYLGGVLFVFYLGWTAIQIPFLAWSGEISGHYHERTRIATYQTVVGSAALFVTLLLPALADQLRPGDGHLQMSLMGALVLATVIPGVFLSLTAFPEVPAPAGPAETLSIKQTLRAVFANTLLLRVLASDFAVTLAQSIRAALIVFYVSFYMGRPDWAAALFLFQFIFGIFAGPIWLRIGLKLGKHRTAVLGELVQVAVNLSLLLVTPDTFGLLLALTLVQGLAQGSGNLMLRAIVADIADKHRLETGEERTGLYYSVFSLAGKGASAIAIGVALPLVAWLGFDPRGSNSPQALLGLAYVFALGPALGHAFSALLLARFPLDEAAHSEIRRQLDDQPLALAPAE